MRSGLVVLAVLAAIAVTALLVPVIHAQVVPTAGRTSDICATVVGVERLDFPRVRVWLRVNASSNADVLSIQGRPQEIIAQSYLRTSGSRVDFSNAENIGAIGAYYLLQGDEIRGKLFSGSSTPGRTGEWYVYGIERTKSGCSVVPTIPTDGPVTSISMKGKVRLTLGAAVHGTSEPVQLSLALENTGTQPEVFRFSSGQQYDFIVTTDGREVWRWSSGRVFIQALTSFSLSRGDKRAFTATWPRTDNDGRPVGPGVYNIQGVVTSSSPPKTTVGPVTVTIRSRT